MREKTNRKYLCRAFALEVVSCALVAANVQADVFNMPAGQTSLLTVPVSNVGNVADPETGNGSVSYAYGIGKYEVTAGQYTSFLNAVAATGVYSLYNPKMVKEFDNTVNVFGCGITQSGNPGNYTYSVAPAFVNRPVNYVSYWDACRFANWLQNGQPVGAEGPGTTETGAYTLTPVGIANNTITRNTGSTWVIPTENEWYKAAYYNPTTSSYFLYPTSSSHTPGNDLADPLGNNANYNTGVADSYPIQSPYYTTIVGQFQNSASPYGTFDQGGNVWEFDEAVTSGVRGIRGSSASADEFFMQSISGFNATSPTDEFFDLGFRVVQIPEPASMGILGLGVMRMLVRRWGAQG